MFIIRKEKADINFFLWPCQNSSDPDSTICESEEVVDALLVSVSVYIEFQSNLLDLHKDLKNE